MNGGIAYHLKQIMTTEQLNLTQTAKLIGISVSSLRKVLKDTPLSQPIMFKINRFIDEHRASAATPDIHPINKPSFTITQTSEHQPGQQPTEVIEPGNAAANRNQRTSQTTKRQAATEQSTSRQANAGQPARGRRGQTSKASDNQQQPARRGKQAANRQNQTSEQAKPSRQSKASETKQATSQQGKAKADQSAGQHQTQSTKTTSKRGQGRSKQGSQSQAAKAEPKRGRNPRSQGNQRGRRNQANSESAANHTVGKQATSQSQSQSVTSQAASQSTASQTPRSQSTRTRRNQRSQSLASATVAESTSQSLAPHSQSQARIDAPATSQAPRPKAVETTLQLFIDESFVHGNSYNRNMYIGLTALDPDDGHALDQFSHTLYPFGWQPGDEVKARGKDQQQVATLLHDAASDTTHNFVVYSPVSDAGNFSMGFGVLYPYLAAVLRVLDALDTVPDKVRIAIDKRNEIEGEQLGIAARILNSYLKSATGKSVIFMLRTADSKEELGLQFSDFVAHSALAFDQPALAGFGIQRLADIGSALGDELMMYSMIGLQKYLLDDHAAVTDSHQYRSPLLVAADRLFRLTSKAVSLREIPAEALAQAKLVLNQLLQVAPSSVSGGINNMPFQNWYDMVARSAAFLHYTDESLPNAEIDPDAMQIANDALNNIANLLASAK